MEFEEVVRALYAAAPEEFVASREELAGQARAGGDRELARRIHALRRPTQAAWAVNLLVHEQPATADQLLSLGSQLREAWTAAEPAALARMSAQRQQTVARLTQLARGLAAGKGRPLGEDAAEEVRQTLDAALADAQVAREVCSGRLVRAHSYAGFGPAEPPWGASGPIPTPGPEGGPRADSAPDPAPAGSRRARPGGRREQAQPAGRLRREPAAAQARAAAQRAARDERARLAALAADAADAAALARGEFDDAAGRHAAAAERETAAQDEVSMLTERLEAAQQRLRTAQRERRQYGRVKDRAAALAEAARRRAERAEARLRQQPES